jgi:hypothetical protein
VILDWLLGVERLCSYVLKGAKTERSRGSSLIRHVKPRTPPTYGGIQSGDEGIFLGPSRKKSYGPAGTRKSVILVIGPYKKEELEEVDPWKDSKVPFIQSRVTHHRYQTIGCDMVKLKAVVLEEVAEEVRWRHAETPFNMRLEHQYLSLVWGRHQNLVVCPPL